MKDRIPEIAHSEVAQSIESENSVEQKKLEYLEEVVGEADLEDIQIFTEMMSLPMLGFGDLHNFFKLEQERSEQELQKMIEKFDAIDPACAKAVTFKLFMKLLKKHGWEKCGRINARMEVVLVPTTFESEVLNK